MAKIKNRSSLLTKYSLMYEKKPKSRVFAPLAETYRKLGMLDDSFRILKDGIKHHPTYTLGYIVLANCYFDIQNYEMAYNTIRPFVAKNLENIKLQKLFAQTCINLGHLEEALQTFKYLLLINPKDEDVAEQVKLLEDDLLVNHDISEEIIDEVENEEDFNEDDWIQVNFSHKKENEEENWEMNQKSPLEDFKEEINSSEIKVDEHKLDDKFFFEDYDKESEDVILPDEDGVIENIEKLEKSSPIITHTLVDLYQEQGHTDKAIQILENILELHPSDTASKSRLDELKLNLNPSQIEQILIGDEVESDENKEYAKIDDIKIAYESFEARLRARSQSKLHSL